jgi:peptide deformylase
MILPIRAYGDPVLRKKCADIDKDYPGLSELLDNMFATMKSAKGVGLAAPQIGRAIRLFIIDSTHMFDKPEKGIKKIFINAQILEEFDEPWPYEEGCLSIPNIREDVTRKESIKIKYLDENFVEHIEKYDDMTARVIQHEYDHIEGVLFIDKISAFKRQLIKSKLNNISKGNVDVDYKMKFPK